MALGNGNHFQILKVLIEKHKISRDRAHDIMFRAEHKGSVQVHDKNITISYSRKSGFSVHAEEEE